MAGKVGLVTGGAGGIGRASAQALARAGARVVVNTARNSEGAHETVDLIEREGGTASVVMADASDGEAIRGLVATTVERYGRLDYAVNNAGVQHDMAPLTELTEEEWDRVLGLNLRGVWLLMKYEIPEMLKNGKGAIVNVGSCLGLVGQRGLAAYVTSKHGVVGLTKVAALDYAAQGIQVNAVAPGTVMTPLVQGMIDAGDVTAQSLIDHHPIGRAGTAEEVGAAVFWLCQESSAFVTGQTVSVDGGYTL